MKISKFVKSAVATAVVAGSAIGASATTFELGLINVGIPKSLSAFAGGSFVSGFSDTFNFTLGSGTNSSGYSVEALDFNFGFLNAKSSFTDISLYRAIDNTLVAGTGGSPSKSLSFGNVATPSGDYYLKVSGVIDSGGNGYFYTGSISSSTVSPVPEPETYAMLLAGLGLMGAIARRRNKA